MLPCRPVRYDTVRCHRRLAADDPAIGQPIEARKPTRRAAKLLSKVALLPAGEDHRRVPLIATGASGDMLDLAPDGACAGYRPE